MRELTQREQAQFGPRGLKQKGGVEWCWQTLSWAKDVFEHKETTEKNWRFALSELEKYRVFEKVPPESPYGSLDALLKAELGVSVKQSIAVKAASPRPLAAPGEIGNGRGSRVDNVNSIGGNGADYLIARIARDRPDILERMKAGEYRSVRQAAIEAGIVKVPTTLEKLTKLWAKATPEERRAFLLEVTA